MGGVPRRSAGRRAHRPDGTRDRAVGGELDAVLPVRVRGLFLADRDLLPLHGLGGDVGRPSRPRVLRDASRRPTDPAPRRFVLGRRSLRSRASCSSTISRWSKANRSRRISRRREPARVGRVVAAHGAPAQRPRRVEDGDVVAARVAVRLRVDAAELADAHRQPRLLEGLARAAGLGPLLPLAEAAGQAPASHERRPRRAARGARGPGGRGSRRRR